ncbi:MAG: ATP-dependent Clp protease adaptor ClpS [Myxococcota bacterium]|nr:ATP-dependent Clp protease adaptor ClpS [Myxococcales bacterium]MEC7751868.1 ATP-dependent Clp protease adaptor ClpS [Myxococcota bacterium]HBU47575.1 ATP-dependent Clp protease adaptor ClpS [Myxococcales bacterium]
MSTDDEHKRETDGDVLVRQKTQRPRKWRILMHNDDFTTMDFVINVLERFFRKSRAEATQLMLEVHQKGIAEVAQLTRDLAETKIAEVEAYCKLHRQPLQLSAEPL